MIFIIIASLTACKPQTETRISMDLSSERLSDSIKKLLDSCLALPAKAMAGTGSPIASPPNSSTSF